MSLPGTPAIREGHHASRLVARCRLSVARREADGLARRESRPGEFLRVNRIPEEACGASRSMLFGRGFDSRRLHQSKVREGFLANEPVGKNLAGLVFVAGLPWNSRFCERGLPRARPVEVWLRGARAGSSQAAGSRFSPKFGLWHEETESRESRSGLPRIAQNIPRSGIPRFGTVLGGSRPFAASTSSRNQLKSQRILFFPLSGHPPIPRYIFWARLVYFWPDSLYRCAQKFPSFAPHPIEGDKRCRPGSPRGPVLFRPLSLGPQDRGSVGPVPGLSSPTRPGRPSPMRAMLPASRLSGSRPTRPKASISL